MKKLIVLLLIANCLLATPSVFSQKINLDLKSYSIENDIQKNVDTVFISEVVNIQEYPPSVSIDSSFLSQKMVTITLKIMAYKVDKWREKRKKVDADDADLRNLESQRKQIEADIQERKNRLQKFKNDKN